MTIHELGSAVAEPSRIALQAHAMHPGVADTPSFRTRLSSRQARRDFEERQAFWARQLPDLRSTLESARAPGLAFFDVVERERIPAVRDGDAFGQTAQAIAHTLKGSSRYLGFVGMGRRAATVEAEAKRGAFENPAALTAALQDEFRRITAFADGYRAQATRS